MVLRLYLPGVQGLKEKRAVVRSLVERLRSRLDVAAAEVGAQDQLQRADVGFAVVSGDVATARRLAEEAQRFAEGELLGRAEVVTAWSMSWCCGRISWGYARSAR
ncbi:MAG: DUF503 domain-containing protein [Chloroflexi bacterium]|nr:DUF503 domain-containing protein [Chloroflexota bacterium]